MKLFVKNLVFTFAVPGTVGVYAPLLLARGRVPRSGLGFVLALTLLVTGGVIYTWCVWKFAAFGRGTPAPHDAPKKLVVRGLYRYTRNPIYMGVLTVLLGWTVMFRAMNLLIYTFSVAICFHLFVVFYEERRLTRQFGAEYDDYRAKVGRWLPPFR